MPGSAWLVLLQNQLDFLFESPGYLFGVIMIIGLLYYYTPQSQNLSLSRGWASVAIGLALIPFIGNLLLGDRGAQAYWDGVKAGREADWRSASDQICRAMDLEESIPLYTFQCGLAVAFLAEQEHDSTLLSRAGEVFEAGLGQDPNWPMHWANLGAIQWSLGETSGALESLTMAAELAPRNSRIALNLGWLQEQSGDSDSAAQSYRRAISSDPWIQFNRLLSQDDSRTGSVNASELYPQATEGLLAALDGWSTLSAGNFEQARRHFTSALIENPGDALAQAALARVIKAEGNPERASEAIGIAIWLGSNSADVNFLAGSISLAQGDEIQALRYFENAVRANSLFSESSAYYARTFLRYFLEPDTVPQLYGLGFLSTSCMEFERIIDFLRELEMQDLANQLGKQQPDVICQLGNIEAPRFGSFPRLSNRRLRR